MRERVESLGGTITLESAARGTKIRIEFPLVYRGENLLPIRVLLADDHPLFRDGVAALLSARGYEVIAEANNGMQALEKVRELPPHIILMDINMPHLDGLATTRILATENPNVHVVVLTISDEDKNPFEAIKSGAQG